MKYPGYRVIFYKQSIAGSRKLEERLDAAIKELLQALDRTNNPFQEVAATRVQFRKTEKVPLIKYINFASMHWRGRQYLSENGITTVADLARLDLDHMAATPGVGRAALEVLVSGLLEHDLYEDGQKLQAFAIKHRLNVTKANRAYRG